MERISAAGNLSIEMDDSRWRLIANGDRAETVVIEAEAGSPLRYTARFAQARRLPEAGTLPLQYIQRVVLGWSHSDESWHLGLLLGPELAQQRGSRWCEIARWPDPDITTFEMLATRAGETLAGVVGRSLYIVPIAPREAAPARPPRPLPPPPLHFNLWTFEAEGNALQFRRARAWALGLVRRIVWYSFWIGVYALLIITTFTSGIAPPRPEFLPLLGGFAALVLVGINLRSLYLLATWPNRLRIDPTRQTVQALRGDSIRWQFERAEISGVYISHVISRRRPGRKSSAIHHSELNLQLSDGQFHHLLTLELPQDQISESQDLPQQDEVLPLTADDVTTEAQAAAVYIATALDLPCWYDRRLQ